MRIELHRIETDGGAAVRYGKGANCVWQAVKIWVRVKIPRLDIGSTSNRARDLIEIIR